MECRNPMQVWISNEKIETNKDGVKVHKLLFKPENLTMLTNGFTGEQNLSKWIDLSGNTYTKRMIGCGKCIECRMNYKKELAKKLELEVKQRKGKNCWFMTFTYNDLCVPKIINNGDIYYSLKRKDATDFIKRCREFVRYNFKDKIVLAFPGEYGEQTHRPHYHAIICGLPLNDLKFIKYDNYNNKIYNSKKIDELWKYNGTVEIKEANEKNIAYTSEYCLKKQEVENIPEFLEKPFIIVSRNIGENYRQEHIEELKEDPFIAMHGTMQKMPKSYIRKYEKEEPKIAEKIKEERQEYAKEQIKNEANLIYNELTSNKPSMQEIREEKAKRNDMNTHRKIRL